MLPRQTGHTYSNTEVTLDGRDFQDCTFNNCVLVYNGGEAAVHGCKFFGCKLQPAGSAASTIQFLKAITNPSSGAQQLFRSTFPGVSVN